MEESMYLITMNDGSVIEHHGVKGMKWGQHIFGLRDMYRYGKASAQYNKAAKRSAKLEKKVASGKDSKRNIKKLQKDKELVESLSQKMNETSKNLSDKQKKAGEAIYKAVVFGKKALTVAALVGGAKAGIDAYNDYQDRVSKNAANDAALEAYQESARRTKFDDGSRAQLEERANQAAQEAAQNAASVSKPSVGNRHLSGEFQNRTRESVKAEAQRTADRILDEAYSVRVSDNGFKTLYSNPVLSKYTPSQAKSIIRTMVKDGANPYRVVEHPEQLARFIKMAPGV